MRELEKKQTEMLLFSHFFIITQPFSSIKLVLESKAVYFAWFPLHAKLHGHVHDLIGAMFNCLTLFCFALRTLASGFVN